ncbi:19140_t:CDS:2 [Funneliformis geosporum]|uniref:13776_t:CDS:1 n=1 Tax=Funneliformis geosporum TaxID=1117311 RepID=A0A9W4SPE8_9GLOM|nr:19140_t:CDS:2 [Funneliformis geosporum]CAI2174388.1 13776_t:CDS:2 [Funneliformis geosporum]
MTRSVLIQAFGNAKLFWMASNATNKIVLRPRDGLEFFAVNYKRNCGLTLEPYNPNINLPQSQRFLIGNEIGQVLPMAIKSCLDAGQNIVAENGPIQDSPLSTKYSDVLKLYWNILSLNLSFTGSFTGKI